MSVVVAKCLDCRDKREVVNATHLLLPSGRTLCRSCYIKRLGMEEIARCEQPQDASTPEIAAAIREYTEALKAARPAKKVIHAIVCPSCRVKTPEALDDKDRENLENMLLAARMKHAIADTVKLNVKGSKRISAMKREFCIAARTAQYSYPRIAKFLGMNHTSVMHLVKTQ